VRPRANVIFTGDDRPGSHKIPRCRQAIKELVEAFAIPGGREHGVVGGQTACPKVNGEGGLVSIDELAVGWGSPEATGSTPHLAPLP
jgi:hypothetical protein